MNQNKNQYDNPIDYKVRDDFTISINTHVPFDEVWWQDGIKDPGVYLISAFDENDIDDDMCWTLLFSEVLETVYCGQSKASMHKRLGKFYNQFIEGRQGRKSTDANHHSAAWKFHDAVVKSGKNPRDVVSDLTVCYAPMKGHSPSAIKLVEQTLIYECRSLKKSLFNKC